MKSRNIADSFKNAVGTVFLLAGAFFVCSTLVSIRAVFADPVAPTANVAQSPRAAASRRASASNYVNRGDGGALTTRATRSRAVTARTTATPRTTTAQPAAAAVRPTTRTTRTIPATSRGNVATTRANAAAATGTPTRGVVSRTNTNVVSRANSGATRAVRARAATTDAANNARVSLQGSAIRGSKRGNTTTSTAYTYTTNKLYTGNYSNIIDSTTGLISAEAYSNCMESYYACMDEICTARNAAQRRCACAGRVRAFAEAEAELETANEELIKVSGELALLVANKGKDISEAFQLTDAEKVMNCVSWHEVVNQYGESSDQAIEWCSNHAIYNNGKTVTTCSQPSYCTANGNSFGFDVSNIDGDASDILASLQSWAAAKENTLTILTNDDDSLTSAFDELNGIVNNVSGIGGALASSEDLKDSLAETWGYELFEYAHNNVCNRVLDSCFNGIYEACGTPPSGGRKCGNGASQCPFNYNSTISVSNTGTYELNFVEANSGYNASNSATCFGYTTTNGDPYVDLRGPVADARRSILQKYALDANADCDAYGDQLRTTAQNLGYQKVAAQQALQQKRLEFANEERETVLNDFVTATSNFNECISEVLSCYEDQRDSNENWSDARIKTYCSQVAEVPHCFEEMICFPSNAPFKAVIDKADSEQCNNSVEYSENTCRNVVTLNEILYGIKTTTPDAECDPGAQSCSSTTMRQKCLIEAIGESASTKGQNAVQGWFKDNPKSDDE